MCIMKKNNNKNYKIKNYYLVIIFIASLFMCVGYATVNNVTLNLAGASSVASQKGIFIYDAQIDENSNANVASSNIALTYGTVLESTVVLNNNVNSTLTMEITIYNKEASTAIFDKVSYGSNFYDNNNIDFTLTGLTHGQEVRSNESVTFTITFKYTDAYKATNPSTFTNTLNSYLNFDFGGSSNVARVNGTEYETLQAAINSIVTSNQTTITLLKDTAENITVNSGKNIVLDLQNHTLSNDGTSPVIENTGTITMTNGTISTNASQGAVNNQVGGVFNMSGGQIIATGSRQAIYNNGGTTNISGSAYLSNNSSDRGAVHNLNNGTVNITGGTIISNNHSAVVNASGTVNIGVKDGNVNTASPSMQGKTYGISNSSTLNFYDGIVKGRTAAFNDEANIHELETGLDIVHGNERISGFDYKTAWLAHAATITYHANGGTVAEPNKVIEAGTAAGSLLVPEYTDYIFDGWFTSASGGTEVTSETIVNADLDIYAHWTYKYDAYIAELGNGNKYYSLQDALDACPTNTQTSVTLLRNTTECVTIATNKRITLDLDSYTLTSNGDPAAITVNGNLTLVGGTIRTSSAKTSAINVESKGTLTMTGGSIYATGDRQALYVNGGKAYISGNSYLSSTAAERATVHNLASGTLTITGGTIVSAKQQAVTNVLGTVTIGEKDGSIDTSKPVLQGKTYGFTNSSTFKFYDGIIKGQTDAISGSVSDIETGSTIVNSTETISGVTYHTAVLN